MTTEQIEGEILLPDDEATEALGHAFGKLLREEGAVVFLEGDLGAGKTTLARAWLRELGVDGPIRSPTYTLVELYEIGGQRWLHLDLYRLNEAAELDQLGLADSPPELGGWLVEWPERGGGRDGGFLPAPQLELRLVTAHDGRRLNWRAGSGLAERIETALKQLKQSVK